MEKIDFCKAEKVKGEENQMEEKKTNQQSRVAESEIIIDSVQPTVSGELSDADA